MKDLNLETMKEVLILRIVSISYSNHFDDDDYQRDLKT